MNKTTEALKMAKDILLELNGHKITYEGQTIVIDTSRQIKACKEALESQEQEPVAWTTEGQIEWLSNKLNNTSVMWNNNSHERMGVKKECKIIPLYTHPAQPLSDDEIKAMWEFYNGKWYDFAQAIQSAHGIK